MFTDQLEPMSLERWRDMKSFISPVCSAEVWETAPAQAPHCFSPFKANLASDVNACIVMQHWCRHECCMNVRCYSKLRNYHMLLLPLPTFLVIMLCGEFGCEHKPLLKYQQNQFTEPQLMKRSSAEEPSLVWPSLLEKGLGPLAWCVHTHACSSISPLWWAWLTVKGYPGRLERMEPILMGSVP